MAEILNVGCHFCRHTYWFRGDWDKSNSYQLIFPSIPWLWDFIKTSKMTHISTLQLANGAEATRPTYCNKDKQLHTNVNINIFMLNKLCLAFQNTWIYLFLGPDWWLMIDLIFGANADLGEQKHSNTNRLANIHTQFICNVMCHCYFSFILNPWNKTRRTCYKCSFFCGRAWVAHCQNRQTGQYITAQQTDRQTAPWMLYKSKMELQTPGTGSTNMILNHFISKTNSP